MFAGCHRLINHRLRHDQHIGQNIAVGHMVGVDHQVEGSRIIASFLEVIPNERPALLVDLLDLLAGGVEAQPFGVGHALRTNLDRPGESHMQGAAARQNRDGRRCKDDPAAACQRDHHIDQMALVMVGF